jgi:hypothetical protein
MVDPIDTIRRLDPLGSTPVTVSGQTRHALAEAIMTSVGESSLEPDRQRRYVPSRRLAIAGAVTAAGVLLVTGVPWSQPSRALAFTDEGDYFLVRVLDVEANAEQYNEEFERYGLDVDLEVVPVSPSVVGLDIGATIEEEAVGISIEREPAGCDETSSAACVPVIRIPRDLRGHASISLGRAARPGEQYDGAGQIDGRGEPLAGLKWRNQTLGDVRKLLARRHTEIAEIQAEYGDERRITDSWFVTGGVPWKPGEVMLFVSEHPAR